MGKRMINSNFYWLIYSFLCIFEGLFFSLAFHVAYGLIQGEKTYTINFNSLKYVDLSSCFLQFKLLFIFLYLRYKPIFYNHTKIILRVGEKKKL